MNQEVVLSPNLAKPHQTAAVVDRSRNPDTAKKRNV